jgi:hypothetical protein
LIQIIDRRLFTAVGAGQLLLFGHARPAFFGYHLAKPECFYTYLALIARRDS